MLHSLQQFVGLHPLESVVALATLVQAGTAILIVWLTSRYTKLTERSTSLANESLKLYRQEFDRQWTPSLHLSLFHTMAATGGTRSKLQIDSLSQSSVIAIRVQVGTDEDEEFETVEVDIPIRGMGTAETPDLTEAILRLLENRLKAAGNTWNGTLRFRVLYPVDGTPIPTPWVHYVVRIENRCIAEHRRKHGVIVDAKQH